MAEYIERERIIADLLDMMKQMKPARDGLRPVSAEAVHGWLNAFPAADVAPRAEVAREIFAELEEMIIHDYDNGGWYFDKLELAALKKKYTEENDG